ncbi:MAG: hypothetical protein OER90_07550, partial [Gemmatimonadota bacterium]|nr:hypothetical protein [Gemmatimonadota bacterium]
RKEGRWVHYRLGTGVGTRATLRLMRSRLQDDPQLDADAHLVQRLRAVPVEELCSASLDLDKLAIPRATVGGH